MNQGQNKPNIDSVLRKLTEDIMNDPEGFFDTERCLACIDAGQRKEIIKKFRDLKKGLVKPGVWIYQPAYSPVLDKLNHLLGFYHTSNFATTQMQTQKQA